MIEIGSSDEFSEASPVKIDAAGQEVLVVRIGEKLHAISDRCSHAKASLSEGEVIAEEAIIECPRHGATFSLETGEALSLPATEAVSVYKVIEEDGAVKLEMDSDE